MKTALPDIFTYNDFRKYIADYQKTRKAHDRTFTKSAFSHLLQLPNTRSYINDVLKGKRVTATFIERFIKALKLPQDEANYFRVLANYNQAATPHEREIYFDRLVALNKTPRTILQEKRFAYYRNWYTGCIRAMLEFNDFSSDYRMLAKKILLPITIKQVKESIDVMKKLGMLRPDKKGFLRPTEKSISSPDYLRDDCIRNHQLQCLNASIAVLTQVNNCPHMIGNNIFSISSAGYKRIQKMVERFRSQIRSAIHKDADKADKVYQISIVLTPLSK